MAFTAPAINEMFGGLPEAQRLDRFEAFKSALSLCHKKAQSGGVSWNGQTIVKTSTPADHIEAVRNDALNKGLSADQVADITSALDRVQDLQKDWSLTNPLNTVPYGNTGMVPYDLEPALALLVPRNFTLRNMTPRIGGIGQAYEFRRILGVSNSNSGNIMNTFFAPTGNTTTVGGVTLNRPANIAYTADRKVLSFKNQGVSDSVDLTAQFAGQGYQDLRQLSHTSAIWAHMLGEERNMLNARSTAIGAITAGTASTDTTVTGSGLPTISGASAVIVTVVSPVGEGQAFSVGNVSSGVAGNGIKITGITGLPVGAIGLATYITIGGVFYRGFTPATNGISPTTFTVVGALPSTSADNGSFNTNAYDGYVTTLTGATAGSVKALNGALSTSEPGGEFQDIFASLFASVIGDPDMILTTAVVRRSLAKALQSGTSNGYRLNYSTGSDGATVGSVITAVQNESTGKMVDVIAHPYMPAGVALVHSTSLPFPDSGVSATVQAVNVQDLTVLEWPQIQMSWDLSTYQYGTLAFRAPAWSGAITGITA